MLPVFNCQQHLFWFAAPFKASPHEHRRPHNLAIFLGFWTSLRVGRCRDLALGTAALGALVVPTLVMAVVVLDEL